MIANGGTADGGNRCAIYIPASERMIMLVPDQIQILICTEPIDMRKGADSLAGVVRDSLSEEPHIRGRSLCFGGSGVTALRFSTGTTTDLRFGANVCKPVVLDFQKLLQAQQK